MTALNNTRAQLAAIHFNRDHSVIAEPGSYWHSIGFVGATYVANRWIPVSKNS